MTDRQTDGRTGAGNDNTRRPKLASGKNGPILGVNLFTEKYIHEIELMG